MRLARVARPTKGSPAVFLSGRRGVSPAKGGQPGGQGSNLATWVVRQARGNLPARGQSRSRGQPLRQESTRHAKVRPADSVRPQAAEVRTRTAEVRTRTAEIRTRTAGIRTRTARVRTRTARVRAQDGEGSDPGRQGSARRRQRRDSAAHTSECSATDAVPKLRPGTTSAPKCPHPQQRSCGSRRRSHPRGGRPRDGRPRGGPAARS